MRGRLERSSWYRGLAVLVISVLAFGGVVQTVQPTSVRASSAPSLLGATSASGQPPSDQQGPGAVSPKVSTKGQLVRQSRYSRTIDNGDGSYTTTFSLRPLYWQDSHGRWQGFDNSLGALSSDPDYSYENASNGYTVRFGKPSGVDTGKPVVYFSSGSDSLKITAISAKPSSISHSGSEVTYNDAYPGIDDEYTLDDERVKESLVLEDSSSVTSGLSFKYYLDLSGLVARQGKDGTIELDDSSGRTVFRTLPPVMTDSSGAESPSVTETLSSVGQGRMQLVVTPDQSWLSDPSRSFPVVLDPSVEQVSYQPDEGVGQDVTVNQDYPGTNYDYQSQLQVGKKATGSKWDTLVQFPELDSVPQDSVVVDATLELYGYSGQSGMAMEAHANLGPWSDSTVTWNSAPSITSAVYASASSVASGWNNLGLTDLVRSWVRGDLGDYGVRLTSTGDNGLQTAFTSSRSTTASQRPKLVVDYVPAGRYGLDGHLTYAAEQDYGGGTSSQVEVSTGDLVLSHDDGSIGARGFGVDLTSTYNSQDPYGQTAYYDNEGANYGEGWTFSENQRLYEIDSGKAVVFKDGSGGADRVFVVSGTSGTTQSYYSPIYYDYTLTKDLSSSADPKRIYTLRPLSSRLSLYFDGGGKLRHIEDGNGNYLDYSYDTDSTNISDPSGKLTQITDVAGRKTTFEYSGTGGRLSKITDMAGRVSTYSYDSDGDLTSITNGAGTPAAATTTFGYGISHHLYYVVNPRGYKSYVVYGVRDRWDTSGDAEGWAADGATSVSQSTAHAYRGSGSLEIDLNLPSNNQCLVPPCPPPAGGASESFSSPVSWSSVQDELVSFVYVPSSAPSLSAQFVLTDSRGVVTQGPLTPLSSGGWTEVRMPNAHIDPGHEVSKVSVMVSPSGSLSGYTGSVWLDNLVVRGQVEHFQDPNGVNDDSFSYDWDGSSHNGTPTTTFSMKDQSGTYQPTTYSYDQAGLVTGVTDPLSNSDSATYDANQRLTSTTDSTGDKTTVGYYDTSNDPKTVTSPANETQAQGENTSNGDVTYTIDPLNEQRKSQGQDYVATVYTHDSYGNTTSEQVNLYSASTDLDSNPGAAPKSQLEKTSYTYGAGGLLSSMTDPRGNTTYYTYDSLTGYLIKIDAPAGSGETSRRVTTITRNVDGGVQKVLDPKGQTTTYAYDDLGHLQKINYYKADGTLDFSTSYILDANGFQTAMSDKTGSSSWTYDENNQLTSESRTQYGVTKTANYSYYADGLLSSMTTFNNQTVNYGYDAAGRLVSQTDPNDTDASGNARSITYSYDSDSRPVITTYPSGVSRRVFYDSAGRVNLVELQTSTGTTVQSFTYDYGSTSAGTYWNGFVRSVSELDGSVVSYSYDDLGRLVSAVRTGTNPFNQSYKYDADGNRTSVTSNGVTTNATYDAANQLTTQGTLSYNYDRNGNLLSYNGVTLTYDASDQLTGGTTSGGTSLGFGYDGNGRRVSRTVGTNRTDYWHNWMGVLSETGDTNVSYLRGFDHQPLSISSGGSVHDYAMDSLGDVTGLVSTGGSLSDTYSYDPWGQSNGSSGSTYNPYRYTGAYSDDATGLYQMGARYYQPSAGRFTQLDPMESTIYDGQRYAYASENPANFTDPSGNNTVWGNCGVSWMFVSNTGLHGVARFNFGVDSNWAMGPVVWIDARVSWIRIGWWFRTGGHNFVGPWHNFVWADAYSDGTGSGWVRGQLSGWVETASGHTCTILGPSDWTWIR